MAATRADTRGSVRADCAFAADRGWALGTGHTCVGAGAAETGDAVAVVVRSGCDDVGADGATGRVGAGRATSAPAGVTCSVVLALVSLDNTRVGAAPADVGTGSSGCGDVDGVASATTGSTAAVADVRRARIVNGSASTSAKSFGSNSIAAKRRLWNGRASSLLSSSDCPALSVTGAANVATGGGIRDVLSTRGRTTGVTLVVVGVTDAWDAGSAAAEGPDRSLMAAADGAVTSIALAETLLPLPSSSSSSSEDEMRSMTVRLAPANGRLFRRRDAGDGDGVTVELFGGAVALYGGKRGFSSTFALLLALVRGLRLAARLWRCRSSMRSYSDAPCVKRVGSPALASRLLNVIGEVADNDGDGDADGWDETASPVLALSFAPTGALRRPPLRYALIV